MGQPAHPSSYLDQPGLSDPGWSFSEKKAPAARYIAATGLVKSWVVIFTEKKAPAARYIAATGLVKFWAVIFTEKKAPAASWIGATGLAKIIPPVTKPNHPSWVG